MVRPIYIPIQVKDAIQNHLNESITRGLRAYESAFEDEDVLTGHLFGLMKIDEQNVIIDDLEVGGTWKWSIDYKKFGGRGKGAPESIIGADGIFELSLYRGDEEMKKSLLFQSKLDWQSRDEKLYLQCSKLITWLGAATIINYTQDELESYSIEDVIANHGRKPSEMKPLIQLLGDDFINCFIGDSDLRYDAFTKRLIWLDRDNETVATKFNINRRLKINVTAPRRFPFQETKIDKIISADEINKHQLNTDLNDFNVGNANTLKELRKIQAKLSKVFHPDRHASLPQAQVDLFSEFMKQINNELDKQKEYIKRKKSNS
ncbi:hypothetical protein SIO70_02945 [Chitinophaga sancti]|uniref:hypothetical protein n=1 Tax=Chitinophaga sancti TaxID=1004 RepID=UPI002A74751D|nr:hypothetical protein [Chitinophaga sancti]WPQ63815.1 hypothetical protein SIO70_02945 [Chitinophaga sancti]